jgi:predicted dehydrogenase
VIRLALVGTGKWGRNFVKTARDIHDVEIVVACRRDTRHRPEWLTERIKLTSNLTAAAKEVDGAIIATPPGSHAECVAPFVERRVPILLEKPVALTFEDAKAIFASAEAKGVTILVDHIHLFAPAFLELRRTVRTWHPLEITSRAGNYGPFRDYSSLFDWGPHDLAMTISLLGPDVQLVSARKTTARAPGEIHELELSSGESRATITIGNGMDAKARCFAVRCGSRNAVYDDLAKSKLVIDDVAVNIDAMLPLEAALRTFVDHIRTGRTDWRFEPRINLDIMRILAEAAAY